MKQLIIVIILLSSFSVNAQPHKGMKKDSRFREKIEQLEKIKLIEILNLDEEKTLRFFSRRNSMRDEAFEIMLKKDELVDLLGEHFTSGKELPKGESFDSINNRINNYEKMLMNNKLNFLSSLKDILTDEQISKLIVFESRFREEIKEKIFEKRGR